MNPRMLTFKTIVSLVLIGLVVLIGLSACLPAEDVEIEEQAKTVQINCVDLPRHQIACSFRSVEGIDCIAVIDWDASALSCNWGE